MTAFLQLNVAGTLKFQVVDTTGDGELWDASPAPMCRLLHRSGAVMMAAATTTNGSLFSTLASVSASQRDISVSSSTGISRWDQLLIGPNSSGQWEWIEVEKKATSTISSMEPLQYSYSTGTVVRSPYLSISVASSVPATVEQSCMAEWTYYVSGEKRIEYSDFDISRYVPRMSVTPSDLASIDARARTMIGSDQRIDRILRHFWNRYVLEDLRGLFGSPGSVISGDRLDRALILRVQEHLAMMAREQDLADHYALQYTAALDAIRASAIDVDESGGQSEEETPRSPNWHRLVRG